MAAALPGTRPFGGDRLHLINGIFCLFSDNVTCIGTWGFYLFDAEFDKEQELRNKIGIICLGSLLDSIEGADRVLEGYVAKALELELPHLKIFCAQADTFVGLIEDVAGSYTREEQVYIASVRDQFVHSWLAKRHRDQVSIKYFDGRQLVREELSAEDYHATIRPFYEDADGFEASLTKLVNRFISEPLEYWSAFRAVKASLPQLQSAMLDDKQYVIPGFVRQE